MPVEKKKWIGKPIIKDPFVAKYPSSAEQDVVFDKLENTEDHLHLDAGPGSGKSTTLLWGMTRHKVKGVAMAFGSDAAASLRPRIPDWIEAITCHAAGRRALAAALGYIILKEDKVKWLLFDNFPQLNPKNHHGDKKGLAYSRLYDTLKIIEMLRVNLVDEKNPSEIQRIMDQYNIEPEDPNEIISIMPKVFELICQNPKVHDYTDMLFLPLRLGLEIPGHEIIYLDERQDLNSMMIAYAERMTRKRIITVGDSQQSIFGFAGADLKSTERLIGRFPGLELPLLTCYRCGTDIVKMVNTVYNKLIPFDKNPTGVVEEVDRLDINKIENGAMILSRRNANLIGPCFAFLKAGRKAIIKGKNIGAGLVKLVEQLKADNIFDLQDKVKDHMHDRIEQLMKRDEPSCSAIEAVEDQCACLLQICGSCSSVDEVKSRINLMFDETVDGVTLSSIHRSKGLEADHVIIIDYSRIRLSHAKMTDEDHVQERNLHYVALSRAKLRLTLIK